LIEKINPKWEDLYDALFQKSKAGSPRLIATSQEKLLAMTALQPRDDIVGSFTLKVENCVKLLN
jgi:hypothetical protein